MSKQQGSTPGAQGAAAAAAGRLAPAPLAGLGSAAAQEDAAVGKPAMSPRTPARRRLSIKEQAAQAAAQQQAEASPRGAFAPGFDSQAEGQAQQRTGSRSRHTGQAQSSPYTNEYEFQGEDEAAPYTGLYRPHFDSDSDSSIDLTAVPARGTRPRTKRRAAAPPAAAGGWTKDGWFVPPPATSAPPSRKRRTSSRADMPPLTRFLSPTKPPPD